MAGLRQLDYEIMLRSLQTGNDKRWAVRLHAKRTVLDIFSQRQQVGTLVRCMNTQRVTKLQKNCKIMNLSEI
jgi:hypothetical protein